MQLLKMAPTQMDVAAVLKLLRPALKSPIGQVVISFVFGYYATMKITQFLTMLMKPLAKSITNGEDDQSALREESEKDAPMLTIQQLTAYDGSRNDQPIYTALNGKIYDLSPSREKFSHHGTFSLLAGCNANLVLNITCGSMGVSAEDVIQRWEQRLNAEFNIIGYLIDAEEGDNVGPDNDDEDVGVEGKDDADKVAKENAV